MQHAADCQCSVCAQQRLTGAPITPQPINTSPVIPPKKVTKIEQLNDKVELYNNNLDGRLKTIEDLVLPKAKIKKRRTIFKSWEFYMMVFGIPGLLYALWLVYLVVEKGKHIRLPF